MKRVLAGCIDLTLEFDSVEEANRYAKGIEEKHQIFNVLKYKELPDGKIRVRRYCHAAGRKSNGNC